MQLKKHFKSIVLLTFLFFMAAPFLFQMEDSNAYSIRVNRNTNVVTVYNDSGGAVKAMTCSVGTGTKTPTGSFSILTKDSWHTLMGPVYAPYCSKVTSDGVWFHPVWYYQNGNRASQSVQSYNMLGTKASHGCIRLTLADAKWIYENCPVGTRVTIFDGSSASDPLGKPATYKLPGTANDWSWDPTDPDPSNPYHSKQPSITVKNNTVQYKTPFRVTDMVTAYDSLGNEVSGSVTYSGSVNTKKLGTYNVTYQLTDQRGRSCSVSSTVTVVDIYLPVLTGVTDSKTIEYNTKLKLKSGVKATGYKNRSLNKKITVKVTTPSKKTVKVKSAYTFNSLGKYTVTYHVYDSKYKRQISQSTVITVQDTKAPVIKNSGASAYYLLLNDTKTVTNNITAHLVSGKKIGKKKFTIEVRVPGSKKYVKTSSAKYHFTKTGLYKFKISAVNPTSKTAASVKKSFRIVNDTKKPTIKGVNTTPTTVSVNTTVTGKDLAKGVTATNKTKADLTGKLLLYYKTPGSSKKIWLSKASSLTFLQVGTYKIYYEVKNPNNGKVKSVGRSFNVIDSSVKITSAVQISTVTLDETDSWDVYTDMEIGSASATEAILKASLIKVTAVSDDPNAPVASILPDGTIKFARTSDTEESFTYKITYAVDNPYYNKVSFSRTVTFLFPGKTTEPETPTVTPVSEAAISAPEISDAKSNEGVEENEISSEKETAAQTDDSVDASVETTDNTDASVETTDSADASIKTADNADSSVETIDSADASVEIADSVDSSVETTDSVNVSVK